MNEPETHIPYGFSILLIYFSVVFIITTVVTLYSLRINIRQKWDLYKCNPFVLPFTNFFQPLQSSSDNFRQCMKDRFQPVLSTYLNKTLNQNFDSAKNLHIDDLQKISSAQNNIRSIENEKSSIYESLNKQKEHVTNTIQYIGIKFESIFQKMIATVWTQYFVLVNLMNIVSLQIVLIRQFVEVSSILLGPIGAIIRELDREAKTNRKCSR